MNIIWPPELREAVYVLAMPRYDDAMHHRHVQESYHDPAEVDRIIWEELTLRLCVLPTLCRLWEWLVYFVLVERTTSSTSSRSPSSSSSRQSAIDDANASTAHMVVVFDTLVPRLLACNGGISDAEKTILAAVHLLLRAFDEDEELHQQQQHHAVSYSYHSPHRHQWQRQQQHAVTTTADHNHENGNSFGADDDDANAVLLPRMLQQWEDEIQQRWRLHNRTDARAAIRIALSHAAVRVLPFLSTQRAWWRALQSALHRQELRMMRRGELVVLEGGGGTSPPSASAFYEHIFAAAVAAASSSSSRRRAALTLMRDDTDNGGGGAEDEGGGSDDDDASSSSHADRWWASTADDVHKAYDLAIIRNHIGALRELGQPHWNIRTLFYARSSMDSNQYNTTFSPHILWRAVERGSIEVLDLVTNALGLSREDLRRRSTHHRFVHKAVERNDTAVLRFLRTRWCLSACHARSNENAALKEAVMHENRLPMMDALRVEWGLTAEDARVDRNFLLRMAVGFNCREVVHSLRHDWGLTVDDAREANVLRVAVLNDDDETGSHREMLHDLRRHWPTL